MIVKTKIKIVLSALLAFTVFAWIAVNQIYANEKIRKAKIEMWIVLK